MKPALGWADPQPHKGGGPSATQLGQNGPEGVLSSGPAEHLPRALGGSPGCLQRMPRLHRARREDLEPGLIQPAESRVTDPWACTWHVLRPLGQLLPSHLRLTDGNSASKPRKSKAHVGVLESMAKAPATPCSPGTIRRRGLLRPGRVSLPSTALTSRPGLPAPAGPRAASPPGPQSPVSKARHRRLLVGRQTVCALDVTSGRDLRCRHVVGAQDGMFPRPRPPLHEPRTLTGRATSTVGCPWWPQHWEAVDGHWTRPDPHKMPQRGLSHGGKGLTQVCRG